MSSRRTARIAGVALVIAIAAAGCGSVARPELREAADAPLAPVEQADFDPAIREPGPIPDSEPLPDSGEVAAETDGAAGDDRGSRADQAEPSAPAPADPAVTPPPPEVAPEPTATPVPPEPTATPVPPAPDVVAGSRPDAPNGRRAPDVADNPTDLAAQIISAETTIRDPNATAAQRADAGHLAQVAYRKLGYEPEWDATVLGSMPANLLPIVELHLKARRSLGELHSGFDAADFIPAWAIIEPESPEALRSYYEEAEAATGIEWEYLAGINLVETGMGRIRGLSGAGAQGPMQFIPTTWDEVGEGDVNDPHDAIQAAARYLVRRGGPADMQGALWGYNNSDLYVEAVSAYAEMVRIDPDAFLGFYYWEIYFATDAGDIWLPLGLSTPETIDLDVYLASAPWSLPDPNLS